MIDNKLLEKLVEELSPVENPFIQRWVIRVEELRRELADLIVNLCRYYDKIPDSGWLVYADLLISVLPSGLKDGKTDFSKSHLRKIDDLANLLETLGEIERADKIRKIIKEG